MYMRIMSDLHLEFGPMDFPAEQPTDADTVLVLAGDVAKAVTKTEYVDFIKQAARQFNHVIWIMGNHEHYGGSLLRSISKIRRNLCITDEVHMHGNISVVENEVVSFDDVDFICGTLWTDFANGNPLAMMKAQMDMNDYNRIRTGNGTGRGAYHRSLLPIDTVECHKKTLAFIVDSITESKNAGKKVVVVTHHAPSHQSVHSRYRADEMNMAYASPLDGLIETLEPDYWIHGHMHDTSDYNIGHTNVVANPRGYFPNEINPEFDPLWTIDLS